jgi:uncharacterized membrane protein YeaQ/YmgE (transglycosylase-associated protein family)
VALVAVDAADPPAGPEAGLSRLRTWLLSVVHFRLSPWQFPRRYSVCSLFKEFKTFQTVHPAHEAYSGEPADISLEENTMFVGSIIGWIVAGLIIGALARLIVPGRHELGLLLTIVLGIIGALVGGFISSMMFGPNIIVDNTGTYAVQTAWPGWIMAIIGATLVLWIVTAIGGGTTTNRLP